MIRIKRVYEAPAAGDGTRFLVDRLWPRGISRAGLPVDAWLKEIAPSDELRAWFAHEPAKWEEFLRRYFAELETKTAALDQIREAARNGDVTLLYSARDQQYNNAEALRLFLAAK